MNHLLDVTRNAAGFALAGTYAGPLGVAGGALAGSLITISEKVILSAAISDLSLREEDFNDNQIIDNERGLDEVDDAEKKREKLYFYESIDVIIMLAVAVFASFYVSAALIGVPITFISICWLEIASVPAFFVTVPFFNLARKFLVPSHRSDLESIICKLDSRVNGNISTSLVAKEN